MLKCDVENPSKGPRQIYDGTGNKTPIHIPPGETKKGVVLAEHVVTMLRQRAVGDDPQNPRALRITEREQVGQPYDPPDPKKEPDLSSMVAQQVSEQVSATFRRELAALAAPAPQQGKR